MKYPKYIQNSKHVDSSFKANIIPVESPSSRTDNKPPDSKAQVNQAVLFFTDKDKAKAEWVLKDVMSGHSNNSEFANLNLYHNSNERNSL